MSEIDTSRYNETSHVQTNKRGIALRKTIDNPYLRRIILGIPFINNEIQDSDVHIMATRITNVGLNHSICVVIFTLAK